MAVPQWILFVALCGLIAIAVQVVTTRLRRVEVDVLEVLDARYARGDITTDEYMRIKRALCAPSEGGQ